jgi:hypothetical protein
VGCQATFELFGKLGATERLDFPVSTSALHDYASLDQKHRRYRHARPVRDDRVRPIGDPDARCNCESARWTIRAVGRLGIGRIRRRRLKPVRKLWSSMAIARYAEMSSAGFPD